MSGLVCLWSESYSAADRAGSILWGGFRGTPSLLHVCVCVCSEWHLLAFFCKCISVNRSVYLPWIGLCPAAAHVLVFVCVCVSALFIFMVTSCCDPALRFCYCFLSVSYCVFLLCHPLFLSLSLSVFPSLCRPWCINPFPSENSLVFSLHS